MTCYHAEGNFLQLPEQELSAMSFFSCLHDCYKRKINFQNWACLRLFTAFRSHETYTRTCLFHFFKSCAVFEAFMVIYLHGLLQSHRLSSSWRKLVFSFPTHFLSARYPYFLQVCNKNLSVAIYIFIHSTTFLVVKSYTFCAIESIH